MPNFDGEYELRIFYTSQPAGFAEIEHRHTIDVNIQQPPDPGMPFSDVFAIRRNGTGDSLEVIVDEYVALLLALFSTTQTIARAELWYIPEGTTNGQYVSTYAIGEDGVNPGDENPAYQGTLTFRSIGGSTMRIQLMEIPIASNLRQPYPTNNALVDNIFAYVAGPMSPFLARDNTPPFAPMNFSGGQNEALFRKRYRQ